MGTAVDGDTRAVHAAALARKRERTNHYEGHTDIDRLRARLEGRGELPRMSVYAPVYAAPVTAAEFFDDRICEWGPQLGDPVAPVLVAIAGAARQGADAAVRAVKVARRLDARAQWVAYRNLEAWRKHADAAKTGAEAIVRAVEREWSRLRLQEVDPDDD